LGGAALIHDLRGQVAERLGSGYFEHAGWLEEVIVDRDHRVPPSAWLGSRQERNVPLVALFSSISLTSDLK
jgi:hypothetical protein